jgi:hypothetical protein
MYEMEYPEVPTVRHPLRHVVVISLLNEEDLKQIMFAIAKHLGYGIEE